MRNLYFRQALFFAAAGLVTSSCVSAGQQQPGVQASPAPSSNASSSSAGAMHTPMGHSPMGMGMSMAPQFPIEMLHPLEAPKGVTALAGQALQIDGQPLRHVKIEIDGQETYTDKTGRFLLENLSFGHHVLNVYGATAKPKRPYGFFQIAVETEKGMTNVLPFTIFIPVLDMEHATHFALQRDKEVVATTPLIPGFEVHIPPGEVLYGVDGKPLTEVTITPIPMMQMPMPGAAGTNPPISFTLQADGATDERPDGTFGPGVSLVFPNTQHLRPGMRVDYWTYDPKIKGGWFIYGAGRVTPDGKKIVPDPGAVLHRLSCSPLNQGPTPNPHPIKCHSDSECKAGDPVDLSTGLFTYKKTDMVIDDIVPIVFGRSYRSFPDFAQSSTGDFGTGAFSSYTSSFWEDSTTDWDIVMPDQSRYHYSCISSTCGGALGTVMQNSTDPGPLFMSTMTATTYPTAPYQGFLYFALRLKDGTSYGYNLNSSQELSYIRDRAGNQLNITHTSTGPIQMIQITSPSGRWLRPTYDSSNRIIQIQDNIGRTVSYTYDANNHVSTVTDAGGGVTTYTYDANDNMLTITDARNILYLSNQYDANNRVIKQTQADGSVYQYAYTLDNNGNVTQTAVTDPRGDIRIVTFNNSSSTSSYWTSNTSDSAGPAPQEAIANRQATTNLVNSTTDALGRQTTMTYDGMGNLLSVTRLAGTPQAVTTSFTYDPTFNQVTSITDPLGHVTSLAYDAFGNLTAVADPLDDQTTFTYNSLGQPLTATDPMGNVTQFAYDSVSNDLVSVTDSLNRISTRASDDVGRLVAVTDPLGHMTRYQYGPLNQITSVTDPLGNQTFFSYDGNGNLLNLTDANSHATQYTYDGMDRVSTRKDPLLNQESYQYDLAGNLAQFTDRRGKVSVYSYDSLNRLTFAGYGMQAGPIYESTVNYAYDAGNRVTQIADSISGTITRDYDGLDRLVSESTPQGAVAYAYDAAGRRASLTVSGQSDANYTFDNANRLTQINQGSSTVSFTYNNAGRRTSMTLPNGITATYNYDDASQLTGLTYASSSTTLGNLSYAYDMAGRRISAGGSYARTNLPLAVSITAYNANNQLTTWGTANLFYDANGNMTSDGTHSYSWDARSRLSQIDSGSTASFVYDSMRRRASKTLSGTSTTFLYDGPNAVQEVIGGNTANSLMGGVDDIFQRTDSSGARSFLTDALGSTLGLADSTGTVQTSYTFDAFGNTTSNGSANSNSFAYTGRELDINAIYYYRARYYNSSLQRFISEDPIGFRSGDTNLYTYVGNRPPNYKDPRGKNPAALAIPALLGTEAVALSATGVGAVVGLTGLAAWDGYLVGELLDTEWQSCDACLALTRPDITPLPTTRLPPMQGRPICFSPPDFPGWDPTKAPGPDWEWRGEPPIGGSDGNWYNPGTDESLHPNLDHPPGIDPHWDWKDPGSGQWWRIFPDGSAQPK